MMFQMKKLCTLKFCAIVVLLRVSHAASDPDGKDVWDIKKKDRVMVKSTAEYNKGNGKIGIINDIYKRTGTVWVDFQDTKGNLTKKYDNQIPIGNVELIKNVEGLAEHLKGLAGRRASRGTGRNLKQHPIRVDIHIEGKGRQRINATVHRVRQYKGYGGSSMNPNKRGSKQVLINYNGRGPRFMMQINIASNKVETVGFDEDHVNRSLFDGWVGKEALFILKTGDDYQDVVATPAQPSDEKYPVSIRELSDIIDKAQASPGIMNISVKIKVLDLYWGGVVGFNEICAIDSHRIVNKKSGNENYRMFKAHFVREDGDEDVTEINIGVKIARDDFPDRVEYFTMDADGGMPPNLAMLGRVDATQTAMISRPHDIKDVDKIWKLEMFLQK